MSREKNPKKQQTLLALGFSMIKKGKTVVGDFADESQIKVCRICKKNLHNMGAFVNHMMWKHQIRITPDGSEREQCGVQKFPKIRNFLETFVSNLTRKLRNFSSRY